MKKQLWIFAICSSLCLPVVSDTTTANELELKEQESITVAQRSKKRRRVRKKRSSSKKELIYALRLARKQDYVEASKALYQLSRSPRYRKERQQIKYILGLMLSELGLYQTAAYQYVGVIQSGNTRYINKALEKLSIAADYLDDERLLNYSMTKIDLNKYPKDQWDMLRYRIGQVYSEKGDLQRAAKYFKKVPQESPFYTRSKYQESLVQAERGNVKQAVRGFLELFNSRNNYGESDPIRVGALMGLARSYYQAKRWDKAIELYKQVPKSSEFWHQSLFELSWAQMRSGKFRSVLSNFHTLHSSYYEVNYIPESLLLRGIVYLYICKYEEMEKTLDTFRQIYLPVANQIKTYMRNRPKNSKVFSDFELFANNFENYAKQIENEGYALPGMIYKHVYEQGNIRAASNYLYKLRREQDAMNSMATSWQNSDVGKSSKRLIAKRIASTESRIGAYVKKHLYDVMDEISSINEQEEFARFEMTNSEKENIRNRMLETEPEKSSIDAEVTRDIYIENGYEYWPFRGEYWLDELGNYHYLGVSSCK